MSLDQWLQPPASRPAARVLLAKAGIIPSRMIVGVAPTRKPKGKGESIYHLTPVVIHRPGTEGERCLPQWFLNLRGITAAVARPLLDRELAAWCPECWE